MRASLPEEVTDLTERVELIEDFLDYFMADEFIRLSPVANKWRTMRQTPYRPQEELPASQT